MEEKLEPRVSRHGRPRRAFLVVPGEYGIYLKGVVVVQLHLLKMHIADWVGPFKTVTFKLIAPAADKRRDITPDLAAAFHKSADFHGVILATPEGWFCEAIDVELREYAEKILTHSKPGYSRLCGGDYCVICRDLYFTEGMEEWRWDLGDLSEILSRRPLPSERWEIPIEIPKHVKKLLPPTIVFRRDQIDSETPFVITILRDEDKIVIEHNPYYVPPPGVE